MKKVKLMRRLSAAQVALGAALLLYLWTADTESEAHVCPDYPREDISAVINRKNWTKEEYDTLFLQTGLSGQAVDALRSAGRQKELLDLQNRFFAEVETQCAPNTVISWAESMEEPGAGQKIATVEEGDILISFNCHVFGWRSGHAGIVTNAEKRQTLEAKVLGTDTEILSLDHWEEYPSFAVLRMKNVSRERRKQIADYAAQNLTEVPYRLTAGLWRRGTKPINGTQCAHLVWYAYNRFGYDLDSDGGRIVTPRDLYESPLLEIIQIYGMDLP